MVHEMASLQGVGSAFLPSSSGLNHLLPPIVQTLLLGKCDS